MVDNLIDFLFLGMYVQCSWFLQIATWFNGLPLCQESSRIIFEMKYITHVCTPLYSIILLYIYLCNFTSKTTQFMM